MSIAESAVRSGTMSQKPWFVLPFARGYQLSLVFLVPYMIANVIWNQLANQDMVHAWELGLDLFGLVNATYLSLIPIFGDKVLPPIYRSVLLHVNASGYHKFLGVHNAWLGAATYGMMVIATWTVCNYQEYHEQASFVLLVLATIGLIFSVRLMRAMFLQIRHVCPFCVISAGTMTTVFLLALRHWIVTGAKIPF